ncbi:MAG: cobalt transporter CbiM [Desulfobacterales bacterium]|nr:MAG: cobalt transporter CbiM [Desulfobacterales bacterium]UCD89472.1 MAG: cobalt transporter CbiM [Desulfobacterales bacterium]
MHISEGVLSPVVLIGGAVAAAAGVAAGLKNLEQNDIPTLGILSAAFFVATLIHVPVGPVSAHLVLNGMVGLILGWKAFPVILIGTALQALLFQYGGITTLGVNTFNMAFPAVICYFLFGWGITPNSRRTVVIITAFCSGFFAVMITGLLVGLSLYLTGEAFLPAAKLIVVAHFPVMLIEGILVVACVLFLKKLRPELLESAYAKR